MKAGRTMIFAAAVALAACSDSGTPPVQPGEKPVAAAAEQRDYGAELLALTNAHIAELVQEQPYLQMMSGMKVKALPDNSIAGAQRQARSAQARLDQLAAIDSSQLSHDDQLTYSMFQGCLLYTSDAADE